LLVLAVVAIFAWLFRGCVGQFLFERLEAPLPPRGHTESVYSGSALHLDKSLLPSGVSITSIFYPFSIVAPGGTLPFDINGSGLSAEIARRVRLETHQPSIESPPLEATDGSRWKGRFLVGEKTPTLVVHPEGEYDSSQGLKPFFLAPPFAVIRSSEVLDVVFMGLDESGRVAQFRVFTNLSSEALKSFSIRATSGAIDVSGLSAQLPFIVDGSLDVSKAAPGRYGLEARLGNKVLWHRDNFIVVGPHGAFKGLPASAGAFFPGTGSLPWAHAVSTVPVHAELIPENIQISRFYYPSSITAPDTQIEFEINGLGFTDSFQRIIGVNPGGAEVAVKRLQYVTTNQITGTFTIGKNASTAVFFPEVTIQGKTVFRAPEPFAVIRPGEVLNLIFQEIGESGTSAWFRVFTNLNPELYGAMSVSFSTAAIHAKNLRPHLPFIVEGSIDTKDAPDGSYDVFVKIHDRIVWARPDYIKVLHAGEKEAGLFEKIESTDGFYRPGDKVKFLIQGSGFREGDVRSFSAEIKGLGALPADFIYVSPGKMELEVDLSSTTAPGTYDLSILQEGRQIRLISQAFVVVPANWIREVTLGWDLMPGSQSVLDLTGRNFDKSFASRLKASSDDPQLSVGRFTWLSPEEMTATISAASGVRPGDYLLHFTVGSTEAEPQAGSLVHVAPKPR